MKRISILSGMLLLACILAELMAPTAEANYQMTTRNYVGSYIQTYVVSGSSDTGTAILTGNSKRADSMCFNNTSSTVWIGTTSTSIPMDEHSNIEIGFPIISSATFSLGGAMTDLMYLTCNTGVSACELRCMEGLTR